MQNENRPEHPDLANVQTTLLRAFLIDIALYAVGMVLISTYSRSEATLAIAFAMVSLAAVHAAWTWCKDGDEPTKS